jgi:hypothetical protein
MRRSDVVVAIIEAPSFYWGGRRSSEAGPGDEVGVRFAAGGGRSSETTEIEDEDEPDVLEVLVTISL